MARSAYLSAIHDDGERTAEQIGELRAAFLGSSSSDASRPVPRHRSQS